MEKMGCKVGCKVFKTEPTCSRVSIEIDRTKTEIDYFIDIECGD